MIKAGKRLLRNKMWGASPHSKEEQVQGFDLYSIGIHENHFRLILKSLLEEKTSYQKSNHRERATYFTNEQQK